MSDQELLRLVEGAGFIFQGKLIGHGAPQERAVPGAERQGATVAVGEILRSTDVMKGLAGREVTLIGEHSSDLKEGSSYVFFTTCVAISENAVLRDLGHLEASADALHDTAEAVRIAEDRPLQRRVAGAELIIDGRAASSRALAKPSIPRSEHDPDWWIAHVTVRRVIKGPKVGKEIDVLFANSNDIAWYKSPKLHEGARGILILRRVDPKEVPEDLDRATYQATDPLDFLPTERLPEVERAMESGKGDR